MSENIKDFSTADIEAAVKTGVTIVDFWAEWCNPCKAMIPVFHEVADEMAGQAVFAKVNVDAGAENARKYGIRSIPAFILFKDGAIAGTKTGAMRKDELVQFVRSAL